MLAYDNFMTARSKLLKMNGAGEGNRTLVSALGRPHSTIEPHPLTSTFISNRLAAVMQGFGEGSSEAENV
jgi:hypothetical protein